MAGGLPVLEVTLRTAAALDAISEMKKVPGAIVGAGTVVDIAGLESAIAAGAEFIVSPGLTDSLGQAAIAKGIPFLPGIANAGDIMRGLDMGLTPFQILSGRGEWRATGLKIAHRPIWPVQILPDRRYQAGYSRRLAGDTTGALRWRQLVGREGQAGFGSD